MALRGLSATAHAAAATVDPAASPLEAFRSGGLRITAQSLR
jgi:hypothetical protein